MDIKKIVYYQHRFLPFSETFVLQQINRLSSFIPHVLYKRSMGIMDQVQAPKQHITFPDKVNLFLKIKAIAPDLIAAHHAVNGMDVLAVARLLNLPLVVFFHGSDTYPFLDRYLTHLTFLKRSRAYIMANCYYMRDKLLAYNFRQERVFVNYTGTDLGLFKFKRYTQKNDILDVVMLGRDIEVKGFPIALDALTKLSPRQRERIRLHYAGGDGIALGKKADELGFREHITFYGKIEHALLPEFLAEMDLMLTPSITTREKFTDGPSCVTQEAMAVGLPIIASRHGGLPELVDHGVNGFLVEEKSSEQIAERLVFFLEHPDSIPAMGVAARQKITERFDIEKNIKGMERRLLGIITNWG